jgi:aminoglycoside/choline kinase family phosphotransferase
MMDRAVEIAGFLVQHKWNDAQQTSFAADFSPRRYARLEQDGRTAILMDADPDQKTMSFVCIAKLLGSFGITSPTIIAADPMRGLVLMEDLGDRNMGVMLDAGADAKPLYLRATDVLIHLHKNFDKTAVQDINLPVFDAALFTVQAELFLDAYLPFTLDREATESERALFSDAWQDALHGIDAMPQTLLLRDFIPDNLMDIAGREGQQSVGVLDFQDAGLGPIAYDLSSLCEVVRRDGCDQMLNDVIAYYHRNAQPPVSVKQLTGACRILAAQRHLRILGIITQLAKKTGRREKLAYAPRVWKYLDILLQDDALKPLRAGLKKIGVR